MRKLLETLARTYSAAHASNIEIEFVGPDHWSVSLDGFKFDWVGSSAKGIDWVEGHVQVPR